MRGPRFRFGNFELDSASNELRKNGLRIRIEDQPSLILSMLISRPGDVVTREELKDALWADDTHLDFDRSLTRAVNKVRVAIDDSASNPLYVETLPKRGYRFVAPVTRLDEPSASELKDVIYLKVEPVFDPIRSDPEFRRILNTIGLDRLGGCV